jgi:hypothetical protein
MNVIYATFIREWTDPENSLCPGQKKGVRGLVPFKPTKRANRNVEQIPVVGAAESSHGGDKKSGRQARLIGLTPPL